MKYKAIILLCLFQLLTIQSYAQEHLKINGIFEKYGKQQGSLFVQLAKDILSQGSNLTLYKSLIINDDPSVRQDIKYAVDSDIYGKLAISEVRVNGVVESGSYFIGTNKGENEYLLYKYKDKKITVVYMRGNFSSKRLDNELKKLKDLFIYVNNKRLKIQ